MPWAFWICLNHDSGGSLYFFSMLSSTLCNVRLGYLWASILRTCALQTRFLFQFRWLLSTPSLGFHSLFWCSNFDIVYLFVENQSLQHSFVLPDGLNVFHVSQPYVRTLCTMLLYSLTFVLLYIFFSHSKEFSRCIAYLDYSTLRVICFSEFACNDIILHRYVNSFCILYLLIFIVCSG